MAIPENRAKDYGDMYEALDKKHDKQSYSKEKYGVPVLQKNGYISGVKIIRKLKLPQINQYTPPSSRYEKNANA